MTGRKQGFLFLGARRILAGSKVELTYGQVSSGHSGGLLFFYAATGSF